MSNNRGNHTLSSITKFSLGTIQIKPDGNKELYLTGNYDGKIRNNNKLPFWKVLSNIKGRKTFSNTHLNKYISDKSNLSMNIRYNDFDDNHKKISIGLNKLELDKTPTDNTLILTLKKDKNNQFNDKILKDIDIDLFGVEFN